MKATTMDKVAACLSMSKRTLYEIFDSKEEMLKQVIGYSHKKHIENLCRIFKEADTVMEAFYLTLKTHQSVMGQASAAFYQDMDSSYARLRPVYDNHRFSRLWEKLRQEVCCMLRTKLMSVPFIFKQALIVDWKTAAKLNKKTEN